LLDLAERCLIVRSSLVILAILGLSLCAAICCHLPVFVAAKGQEEGNVPNHDFLREERRLMSVTLKPVAFATAS
jgi:hypothetical protein